jgi:hypothetical protein
MRRLTNGMWLSAIGLVHQLFGLLSAAGLVPIPGVGSRNLLLEIWRGGVIGTIESDATRSIFFWYFFFGLLLLMLGGVMHALERAGHRTPAGLGWQLAGLGIAGAALIPASGFWLVFPVAFRVVRDGKELHPS